MGWFALEDERGREQGVIGDEPLDSFGVAMKEVFEQYRKNFKRIPSADEVHICVSWAYATQIWDSRGEDTYDDWPWGEEDIVTKALLEAMEALYGEKINGKAID